MYVGVLLSQLNQHALLKVKLQLFFDLTYLCLLYLIFITSLIIVTFGEIIRCNTDERLEIQMNPSTCQYIGNFHAKNIN